MKRLLTSMITVTALAVAGAANPFDSAVLAGSRSQPNRVGPGHTTSTTAAPSTVRRHPSPGLLLGNGTAPVCAAAASDAPAWLVRRVTQDGVVVPASNQPRPGTLGAGHLQDAYSLNDWSGTRGGGETVAIVLWFDDPTAESDMNVYRAQYGLPSCTSASGCFRKVNEKGKPQPLPRTPVK